jgi:uncharacterized repeat protein (TIGR01451 family)
MPPLLFVQFRGPAGSRALFYEGDACGRAFDSPVTVGLRPGYHYRVQLTDFPEHPRLSLFPTVEVRGLVAYPPGINAADFAVPLVITKEDVDRALSGALVAKAYYLENPDLAFPVATRPDQPIELEVPPARCLEDEARARGRLLVILRLGERQADLGELAGANVPGTVLLPGAGALSLPAAPPCVPWACWTVYDPRLGPKRPFEECLCDGGDVGIPVGLGADGQLRGVDPTDAAARYDCLGCRKVTISNRVCLFAPRFVALRSEFVPAGYATVQTPAAAASTLAQFLLEERRGSRVYVQVKAPVVAYAPLRPSEVETAQGLLRVEQILETVVATARLQGAEIVGVCVKPPVPCGPLALCKWADAKAAQVGDVVTFYLKYTNTGGQPMTNVAVTDSLSARLEYVPGSERTDREGVFTAQENESGSLILRWEFGGALAPGQSGMIRFQARVR